MRSPRLTGFALLAGLSLLGLVAALAHGQRDSWKDELDGVRKQRLQVERQLKALREREGVLQRATEARDKGYYARLEIKGRLEKQVVPHQGVFDTGRQVVWTVRAGENRYELFFDNHPSREAFARLAEKQAGKSVLVTGTLAAPRHPEPQFLEVKTFRAAEKD
jgi:hypothetical protein